MKALPYLGLFFFLCAMHPLKAQTAKKNIVGIVKDGQTLQPVPYAHAFSSSLGTYTNERGIFSLPADTADMLHISHINYQFHRVPVRDIQHDTLFVFLRPRDKVLDEILVRGLPTEEKFKQQILNTQIEPTAEEVHAKNNIGQTKKLFLSGYVPTMGSEDNYRNYTRGPQGVSFFSTGPSKGLFKAFGNISRSRQLWKTISLSTLPIATDTLWNRIGFPRRDSLVSDSLQPATTKTFHE
uniref:Carboxypeptidase-like regulatory domain-containing protein n=1 Tax=Roseihalotalea indica TaxID=2867963 RepID=A0AA49GJA7_9BACT|nr:carboxypeptidase-like regulatory domain-containing protein [Tunicatimonas sp. TK19036]